MTAEEFLEYIGEAACFRDKGGQRLARAKRAYGAYIQAYREMSLEKLCFSARFAGGSENAAVFKAVQDRDNGAPMVNAPELL